MAGWIRTLSAIALGSILVLGVAAPAAAGPPRRTLVDITDTPEGRAQVAAAIALRAERGQRQSRGELRVFRFGADGHVVAPRGIRVLGASATTDPDGRTAIRVDVQVAAPDAAVAVRRPALSATLAGPAWQWLGGDCFDVLSSTFGYSVSCYALSRVVSDGSATRDYWALEHWSVTGPDFNGGLTPNAKIYDSWIATVRAPSSPVMSWMDWSPRGDKTGSCQPIGLSITVLKLPMSGTYEMCEQWDATWYSEGGRFRNQWRCGCFFPFGVSGDREVAYLEAVSVANGMAPAWVLSQGFLAW